jgi:hypothetical protein
MTLTGVTLALAACAAAPAQAPHVAEPVMSVQQTELPAPGATSSNAQRAERDAAAILAAFVAPPGAQRLKAAPGVAGGVLETPAQRPLTPDLADKAGWWRVAGDPRQVLSWAAKHLPRGFTPSGEETGSGGGNTGSMAADMFALPPVAGVLSSRQLIIEVAGAGEGQTDIRADAEVIWLPERGPGASIPAGASAVTLALHPDVNVHVKPPNPVTVTGPAKVGKLAALINGLPAFPAGAYSCPFDGGAALVLTFSAGQGGPELAVATVSLEGCEGVGLVTGGKHQPGLGAVDGGRQVAARALKVAGLNWDRLDPA